MSVDVKKRSEIPELYKWDLTKMYASDEEWKKEMDSFDEAAAGIPAFKGTLTQSPARLREWLDYSTAIERKMNQLATYASLRRSEDSREEAAQIMFSKAYAKSVQVEAVASFADPEILSMSEDQLNKFVEAPELAPYRFKMECLRRQKPYVLSAEEEKILTGIGEIVAAPGEISDMLLDADMTFDPVTDSKGKEIPVTQAGFISLQSTKDRSLRRASFQSFYKEFKQHINTFAAIYAANVKADVFVAKTRHYAGARAMSMARENIPESVYDGLIATVHKHMPAMHRYVQLRKEILGVDELHSYDLYTPLAREVDLMYSYEDAQKMVLKATAPLGEEYTKVVQKAFDERWIDVYPNEGKSGGAFSSGTYDSAPYIMLNYTGTVDSVSTIAHEMGHSMHSYLSHTNQPPQYAYYEIFVAEVASTVNENLMIEQMLAQDIEAPMRLYLLNQYLENFKGTVYRQTMFAEFEKIAHERVEEGEALSAEGLCQIYASLVQEYYGKDLVADPEIRYEWARIPHFYRAFYVYKYATSYAAAVALSDGILKNGEKAVRPYLEFLTLGGSMDPLESLKHAGIDMTTPDPIDRALEKFEAILDETERVYREIRKEKE